VLARATFGQRRTTLPAEAPAEPKAPPPPAAATKPPKLATIAFFEPVTPETLQRLALQTAAAIAADVEQLTLLLASPGGTLLPALEFYQLLLKTRIKLKTHAVGRVASAATILMLAGEERTAQPDASFLFHPVSTELRPPINSFAERSVDRHLALYELTAREVYRTRTCLPHDMIASFARGETILDAEQALAFGVIHRVEDVTKGAAPEA
jgi:ATP-dependent protease ClpP protease subunit